MKWGVRRYQNKDGSLTEAGKKRLLNREYRADKKTARTLKRNVAAGKKNMKMRGKLANENESVYKEANRQYTKALSKPSFSKKKKLDRITEASDNLREASKAAEKTRGDLNRAERIYDADAAKYREHINKMTNKYSSKKIKQISTKQVDLGDHWTKEVIKTGITLADLPVIGTSYSGKYNARQEQKDRDRILNANANKRY